MAYNNFTSFPKAISDLQLTHTEDHLFESVSEAPLPEHLLLNLEQGSDLALALSTEKAKSEFVIAPLLLHVKTLLKNRIGLFSGVDLNVDNERGLNGVCDFIISRDGRQYVLTAPLIAIVEAKNDNIHNGLGQCVAEMCAAQLFNKQGNQDSVPKIEQIYGCVTIGSAWKFMKLAGNVVTLDIDEYYIDRPQKIVGIFLHIIENG